MARPNTRVVLNRAKFAEIDVLFGDALHAVGDQVIRTANPPDATPYGVGLVTTGDVGTWLGGKKVAGGALKPRSERLGKSGEVRVLFGFGFPGRFQEHGTVHHPPQPFLTPAIDATLPAMAAIVANVMQRLR